MLNTFYCGSYNILKILRFFCPQKVEKKHPQKLLRITQIHFFSLLPELPKWPKQKNSCSKMWPTDQLYIELGGRLHPSHRLVPTKFFGHSGAPFGNGVHIT